MYRYVMASVLSTIFAQTVLAIVYGARIIPSAVWATLFANISAAFPSYFLNRNWTWRKTGKSSFKSEIFPFWMLSFLGIGFGEVGSLVARHLINAHHWPHLINLIVVCSLSLTSFAIFWVLKLKIFNKIFHSPEMEDIELAVTREELAGN